MTIRRVMPKQFNRRVRMYSVDSVTVKGENTRVERYQGTRWAGIRPVSVRVQERLQATGNKTVAESTIQVMMRYHATVKPSWRITLGDGARTLEILGVEHVDEDNRVTRLLCKEATDG